MKVAIPARRAVSARRSARGPAIKAISPAANAYKLSTSARIRDQLPKVAIGTRADPSFFQTLVVQANNLLKRALSAVISVTSPGQNGAFGGRQPGQVKSTFT